MRAQRRQARHRALQCLYQLDVQDQLRSEPVAGERQSEPFDARSWEEISIVSEAESPANDVLTYARGLVEETWRRRAELDELIQAASKHWEISRMTVVDRSLLRMAIVEMLYRDEPPAKVAIDEAIELGREFGTEESPQFINGILDAIRKHQASTSTDTN